MKRLLILSLLIVLSACGGRQDNDVFIWDENVENSFYGETLTIAVMEGRLQNDQLRRFAELYMTNNPGVEVEIIFLDSDRDIARDQLGVQLMAGQSPILMDAGIVNLRNRRFFADWMPLINSHPGLNDDEWFMNAFYALKEDGRLYSFPETISFNYVSGNKNVPGLSEKLTSRQTISMDEMIAIYMEFGGLDSGLGLSFSDAPIANSLWFTSDFLDFESGFVNFTSPRFISMLEAYSNALRPFPDSVRAEMMRMGDWRRLLAEYFMFSVDGFPPIEDSLLLGESSFGNASLFATSYGELVIFTALNTWALSSAATNIQQALAIDFLRFSQDSTDAEVRHIHSTAQVFFLGVIPLNRARFDYNLRRDLYFVASGYERNNRLAKSRFEARDYLIYQIYFAMNLPMVKAPGVPTPIVSFFNEILESLNLGLISPHEAATALQNRVVLEILEDN